MPLTAPTAPTAEPEHQQNTNDLPDATVAPLESHTNSSEDISPPLHRGARMIVLLSVVSPPLALIAAMWLAWGNGFSPIDLALFAGMYLLCGLGITVGLHRYFTHKSFDCPRWVKCGLGITASMSCQGDLFWWCAVHRQHHQHSDEEHDPHSPNIGSDSRIKRFLYSHFGWLFDIEQPDLERYVPDLISDKDLRFINRLFPLWVALGLAIPTVLGGVITGTWAGALTGLLWGGIIRIGLEHHVTWSVNSVCHIWGKQPYESRDHSRNNPIVGVLALGEGWHNNHHAFPTSARHGLAWWQFDATWVAIRLMSFVGMAKNIKTPTNERMDRSRKVASERS
ncbi:MAG: fatty acid desaturase [Phycisphaerales bacterium]|nr:fatty acid desaturase [Phycisphaerales bacterium]